MNTRLLTEDARLRHLLKTISWRIIGTIDTILLGWWLSGDFKVGGLHRRYGTPYEDGALLWP